MEPTSAPLRCSLLALAIAGGVYAGLRAGAVSATQAQPPRTNRAAFMQQHFASVMKLHEAVIRGDLKTARTEARAIADRPDPLDLPKAAAPYVVSMQQAAARAADAEELEDVAASTAAMLATCGDC